MNYQTNTNYSTGYQEPSLGDLFSNLSSQAGLLIRQEMQLAQAEMTRKATRAGRHAAIIAVGGVIALGAFLALVAALILILAQWMAAWVAALLVGIVLAIVAGVLVQHGAKKLKEIDPAPRRTLETMRENKEWLTQQI
jgi:MFS family permease